MSNEDILGTKVLYVGNTREDLYDYVGVVEAATDAASVGVRYPVGVGEPYRGKDGLVWASRWAWKVVKPELSVVSNLDETEMDKLFSNAAGGPREQILNEIARLESRLAELKSALKVIDSL